MSNSEKIQELSDSPHIGGMKMSSSLKERLKRNSRSFSSPVCPTAKSLLKASTILSDTYEPNSQNIVSTPTHTHTPCSYSLEDIEKCDDQIMLQQTFFGLKNQVHQKEEKLRKLELVENYHKKMKPEDLLILIEKWLKTSQESLQALREKLPENNSDIQCLLGMLNIDKSTIRFDSESNAFY